MKQLIMVSAAALITMGAAIASINEANAFVCARGVYRAGCVGARGGVVVRVRRGYIAPRGGVVVRRHYGAYGGRTVVRRRVY